MTPMRNYLSRADRYFKGIFLFLLSTLLAGHLAMGQDRCAVSEDTYQETPDQFESWMRKLQVSDAGRTSNEILTIPVVFHIIHQGEPVGQGRNLSLERIEQQMATLNQDFRRTNTDAISTPDDFLPVASDVQIEFVLAQQDPLGLPTNGVTRTIGSLFSYRFQDDAVLKSEVYWPAEDYLNIYVANLESFLGWASFPFSNLAGIDEINNERLTDGIAVDYEYIGMNPDAREFESLGRTATHEIGHFLGLKHTWGDGGCDADDFCADTPLSNTSYQGQCPADEVSSCSTSDMYSNFLNYTDDACMNLFTICQRDRMRTVLTNSIRRKSLISSRALEAPVMTNNDLGISKDQSISEWLCNPEQRPTLLVRNFGTNPINTFQIQALLDDEVQETHTAAFSLASGEAASIIFLPLVRNNTTDQRLTFQVLSVNETADTNPFNDTFTTLVPPTTPVGLPYIEDFESTTPLITRTELSENSLWIKQVAPYATSTNTAGQLGFHNNEDNLGEFHSLLLPNLDFTGVNSASLNFRYAYSGITGVSSKDGLIVAASTDCGVTYDQVLFSNYGDDLVTVNRGVTSSFIPAGPSEWREVELNITSLLDPQLRLAFIGQNGGQNNLYLDDIQVVATELQALDVGITAVDQLPIVTCADFISPRVTVANFGFETINSYGLQFDFGDRAGVTGINTELISGASETNPIPIGGLEEGNYTLTLSTTTPNQQGDDAPTNDTFTRNLIINRTELTLPIRETFGQLAPWVTVNPTGNSIWKPYEANGQYMQAEAFATADLGATHWLVSPILNTGNLTEGTLQFRMAHAQTGNALDRLQVFISVNCGQSYDQVIYDKFGAELSTTNSSEAFFPDDENNWRTETIDISEYMIWQDIRLAFVFTNGGGNHLFLDELEVFPVRPEFLKTFDRAITVYPNPAQDQFSVTVDLPNKDEIVVSLVDLSGRIIAQFLEPNGLNQTYQFQVDQLNGIYVVHVSGQNFEASPRVIVTK